MIRSKIFVLAVFLIGSFASFQTSHGGPIVFDQALRKKVVARIDKEIRDNFSHWQALEGFNYQDKFDAYQKKAVPLDDRREFSLLTEAFVASLNNGHTQFNDPFLYASDPGNLGFRLAYLPEGWTVTHSSREELLAGTVILEIDGRPFENFYQKVKVQLNASSDRARRSGLSSYHGLFPSVFSLRMNDGQVVNIDRRIKLPGIKPNSVSVSHHWINKDAIAYIKIPSFSESHYEDEARTLLKTSYANSKKIILDLRGNRGGSTPSRLGRQLLGQEWRHWNTSGPATLIADISRAVPAQAKYFLIIDRECGSACEDFAMPFSLSSNAILVGETTAGTSGQPAITKWENGMELWVGSRRQWFPDGREFEGVGVEPDLAIVMNAEDFRRDSSDRMLACALVREKCD